MRYAGLALLLLAVAGCGKKSSGSCTAPTIVFRSPLSGQSVGGVVPVQLTVTSTCALASVDVSAAGALVAHMTSPPFSTLWNTATLADGSYAIDATAVDVDGNTGKASISVQTSQPCVTGQPCPPKVRFVTPAANATVCGQVTLYADVTVDSGVPSVTFLADGQALGAAQTGGPYLQDWNTASLTPGVHSIEAQAVDAAGLMGAYTLDVTVAAAGQCTPQGPVVAFACPPPDPQGHLTCASGSVALCADAHDTATITSVSYGIGGVPLVGTTPTGAQWTTTWDTTSATDGIYQLQAKASDSQGLDDTDTRSFQVDNTPPTITFSEPSAGAMIAVGSMVSLDVSASDGTGCGVAQVVFDISGPTSATLTSMAAPYSQSWDTTGLAPGAYTVSALVTDAGGLTATTTVAVTLVSG